MENYKYKYTKYKNKYAELKNQKNIHLMSLSGGESTEKSLESNAPYDNKMDAKELIIYPQKSFITILAHPAEQMLLPGFVEDSVIFLKNNGTIGKSTIFKNNDSLREKISKNKEIMVIQEDNSQIKGTVESIGPKMIVLIDENDKFTMIRKWKSAVMLSGRHTKPYIKTKEPGTIQYMLNTITWSPNYYLYLDTDDLENAIGILYFMALISNATGYNINVSNIILVAGDTKMESMKITTESFTRKSLELAPTQAQNNYTNQEPVAELLTYQLDSQLFLGEKITQPILKFDLDNITKKYIIDVNAYVDIKEQFIEASYGYSILVSNTDLPSGIIRIFAKSSKFGANVALGSIKVSRTPKNTPMEIMLGKTPRIRANLSKEDGNDQIENGVIKKTKYSINKIKISGTIINSTTKIEKVIIRDYIGNATILNTDGDPIHKMGYLEWTIKIKPGEIAISIGYQIRY
jgi:hypothetical protein